MTKILIVDDHEIMRKGLSLVFELEDEFEFIGEACDGEEAVRKVSEARPDIILMDIRMPKMNGILAAKQIKKRFPKTKIMILTAVDDEDELVLALRSGVDGLILKNVSSDELTRAVKAVASGQSYMHPIIARKALNKINNKELTPEPSRQLTDRELLVLRLIAEGYKNKEIAAKLYLSEETVKSHVSHMLAKLDQSDRMGAVLYAIRHNLVSIGKEEASE